MMYKNAASVNDSNTTSPINVISRDFRTVPPYIF